MMEGGGGGGGGGGAQPLHILCPYEILLRSVITDSRSETMATKTKRKLKESDYPSVLTYFQKKSKGWFSIVASTWHRALYK